MLPFHRSHYLNQGEKENVLHKVTSLYNVLYNVFPNFDAVDVKIPISIGKGPVPKMGKKLHYLII